MGELTGTSFIFFALFAIVLCAMYLVIRRGMAPIGPTALVGTVVNIALVAMISASVENHPAQVIFVGLVVGGLFSITSVAMAAFFRSNEAGVSEIKQAMLEQAADQPRSTGNGEM